LKRIKIFVNKIYFIVFYMLGIIKYYNDNYYDAYNYFKKAVKYYQKDFEAYFLMGECAFFLKDFEMAFEYFIISRHLLAKSGFNNDEKIYLKKIILKELIQLSLILDKMELYEKYKNIFYSITFNKNNISKILIDKWMGYSLQFKEM